MDIYRKGFRSYYLNYREQKYALRKKTTDFEAILIGGIGSGTSDSTLY